MYKLNWKRGVLVLIILLGGFLRFFKLSEFPVQLNHDEISQLYDAISIIKTKKDIYGNFMPLVFPSTGDYKNGIYTYISTIPILLFGEKDYAIRIPIAFFGTLTILAVFLFIKILTKNWIIALMSAALVAVTPSEIFYSRKSFESEIGVCLDFFGFFCLLNTRNRILGYMGIFLLSTAMYIYTAQTIVVPFLIFLVAFLLKDEIKVSKKYFIFLLTLWVILITPFLWLSLSNKELRFRASTVFITQDTNFGKLVSLNGNYYKSLLDLVFLKFLNQFNPSYLFINGLDLTNQSILGVGPLLLWQFPFVILGIVFFLRRKTFFNQGLFLLGLTVISFIPSAITFEDYSPHRSMLAFTTLSIVSSFGLYWLILTIKEKFKYKILKTSILIILFFALLLNCLYFIKIYISSYTYEKPQNIQFPFKLISEYIWLEYNNFNQIIFDPQFGETAPMVGVGAHYYIAYYGHYPPEKFQREYKVGKKPREVLFDKFSIRQVYWPEDKNLKNALIIVSPWSVPMVDVKNGLIIKKFYFYDGTLALYAIRL